MGETISKSDADELKSKYQQCKSDIAELTKAVKDQAAGRAKEWAEQHPLAAVGIVAGVAASLGFVLGLLVARHRE